MPNDERPSSSTASATPSTSTAPGRARSPIRIGLAPYGSLTGRRLSNESLPKRPQFDSPPPARDSPHSRRDGQGSSTSHRHSRYDDRPAHYDDRRRSPPPSHRRSPSPRRRSPPPSSSHRRRSPSPRPYGASSSFYSSSAPSHRPSNGHASNGRSSRYDDPPSSTASSSRRTSVTASDKPSAPSTSSSRPPAPEPPSSRPPPPPTSRPPPPPSTAPSSRPYTTRPSSAFDKLPAFFYKPLGAKDFRVTYDPTLDPNPIKKGKEVVQRFDGEGLTESTKDPRRPEDAEEKAKIEKRMQRGPYMKKLAVVTYSWDKNSTGPPPPAPPSAVLVTGFPSTTTADALHAHFRSYGRIETQDVKYDSQTGGSLGICWIKFVDDVPRDAEPDKPTREKYERKRRSGQAQDGGAIALQAVEKANGAKVGMAMLMGDVGVTVVLDADGVKCKAAVKAEMDKRHPPKTEKKPLPPPSSSSRAPPLPSSAPPAPPSQPPPPPPPTTAPPPPPPRLPLPPQTSLYAPPPRSSRFGAVPGLPATPLPAAPSGPRFSGQAAPTGSRGAARGAPPMGPSSMSGGGGGATPSSVTRDAAPHLSLPTKPVPLVVPTISRAEVATHVSVPSMVIPPLPPRRPVTTSSSSSTSAPAKSAPVSLLPKPPARAGLPSNPLSHNSRFGAPSSRERGGRGGGRHGGPLRADSMASAIAQAVEAAKRRLKKSQSARTAEEEEADMELDSEEEGASKSGAGGSESEEEEEGEEEEDKKDAVFYHRTSGRPQSRTILPRGIAPVGAIAWQASKKVLLEKLAANGKQYLKIDKTRFQEKRDGQGGRSAVPNAEELEKHFGKYEIDRTFADSEGWYITFKESSAAKEALEALSGKKLGGAPLEFLLEDPPTIVPPSTAVTPATTSAAAKPNSRNSKAPEPGSHLAALVEKLTRRPTPVKAKKTSGWTDAELVEEAKEIVIADLLEAFTNDIRTRLVRGKVQEHLQALDQQERRGVKAEPSPSVTPAPLPFANHVKPEPGRESPLLNGSAPLPSTSASTAASTSAAPKSLSALSFAKRKSTNYSQQDDRHRRRGSTSTRRSSEGPSESPAPGFGHHSSDDDSYARRRGKNGSKKSSSSKSKSSKARAAFSDSEESSADERVRRRKSDSGKSRSKKAAAEGKRSSRPSVDYTSSEGEDEEEEPKKLARVKEEEDDSNSTVTASASVAPPSPAGSGSPELVDFSAFRRPKKPVDVDEEDDDGMDVDEDDSPAPVKVKGKLVRGRRPSLVVGKVEEVDEEIERKPKQEIRVPTSYEPFEAGLAGDEEDLYYLKLALERLQLGQDLHPTPPPSDDEGAASQKHASGSARTEGFYKITIEEKMANRPASNKAKAAETAKATAAAGTSSVAVSRLARANTRGLVRGMELHKKVTATDTDVLKFNQLKTRKKQLTFSRSGIEGYGLFAVEFIPAGDMVIEYVGELIRQQVADRREKAYERQGIGSSYLFRLDEDLVVDATKKGNLGRLINHCCAPNCTARIITINGVKKIVIYAKTNILPGHEVTYDYHFPIEENKVACLCGHPQCRGTLN